MKERKFYGFGLKGLIEYAIPETAKLGQMFLLLDRRFGYPKLKWYHRMQDWLKTRLFCALNNYREIKIYGEEGWYLEPRIRETPDRIITIGDRRFKVHLYKPVFERDKFTLALYGRYV